MTMRQRTRARPSSGAITFLPPAATRSAGPALARFSKRPYQSRIAIGALTAQSRRDQRGRRKMLHSS